MKKIFLVLILFVFVGFLISATTQYNELGEIIYPGGNATIRFNDSGGLDNRLYNATGSPSVKGTIVCSSTAVNGRFIVCPGATKKAIAIVAEDGIADGELTWITVAGRASVLLKDSTAATRGNWVSMSITDGRADATNADPPASGGLVQEAALTQIGRASQTLSGGTDVLLNIFIQFN